MKQLRIPVYEVERPSPDWVAFRFETAEYGPLIESMERDRNWGGVAWVLTMSRPSRPRTTGERSQNHHLNGHCQQIAFETGHDMDEIKLYVKRKAFRRGLPWRVDPLGNPITSLVDGEPLPISERDMNTEQCAWCIEEAHQLADELGIRLIESDVQEEIAG